VSRVCTPRRLPAAFTARSRAEASASADTRTLKRALYDQTNGSIEAERCCSRAVAAGSRCRPYPPPTPP
jgi:hypothetical protein